MKTKSVLLVLVLLNGFLASCGKVENTSNQQSSKYFSQFVTASENSPVQQDLRLLRRVQVQNGTFFNSVQPNRTFATGSIKLRIDQNGTYMMYLTHETIDYENDDNIRAISGQWYFENDRMVFKNLGETLDYDIMNQSSLINGVSISSVQIASGCFALSIKERVSFQYSTFVNAYDVAQTYLYNNDLNYIDVGVYEICKTI